MNSNFLVFIFCIIFISANCNDIKEEDNVLILTNENFDDALKLHPKILVEFYAPWCGHCKALAPEYAKAANKLKEDNSPIKLSKVDATVETKLAERYKVNGYPSLTFFDDGEAIEYTGRNTAEGIVSWLYKKTGPPSLELSDVQSAKDFISSSKVVVMGFFKDLNSNEALIFNEVAKETDDVPFAITDKSSIFAEFKIEDSNHIALFKNFDEGRVDFTGNIVKDEIDKFIKDNMLPLFIEFTQDDASLIFDGAIKKHLLAFLSKKSDEFLSYSKYFEAVARLYRGRVLFVLIDTDVNENENVLEFFGITRPSVPSYRMVDLTDEPIKYSPTKVEFSEDKIKDFVESVLSGQLKPQLNTQDLPVDWDKQPVKVLVGSNFNSVARDPAKAVFVEFYAPWCGHCKELAPIWDELAEHYIKNSDIVIAKIDSTQNDLEGIKIQGFPTIKYFPKGSDSVIDYVGGRTLDAFKTFLDSEGKEGNIPVELPSDEAEDEEGDDAEEDSTTHDGGEL